MFTEYEFLIYDQLDSTQNEAKRLAQSGYSKNVVILANQQTVARGREGRQWVSEKGNLFYTIMLNNISVAIEDQPFFCFIAGLSVHNIISSFKAVHNKYNIYLKWPNDIMVDDKKLCGILLESITINKIPRLFIGIGINIISSPRNINRPTTYLHELGVKSTTSQKLLAKLIPKFEEYCNLWKTKGNEFIISEWRKKAYKLNKEIIFKIDRKNIVDSVEIPTSVQYDSNKQLVPRTENEDVAVSNPLTIQGIFRDINFNGDILIETRDKQLLKFSIGEIF